MKFRPTMEATKNLKGGVGTVYCSNDLQVGNVVVSCMRIPPGASIGKHLHEDNEEIYIVLEGKYAIINGIKRMMDICRIGEEHDCVNETDKDLIILSIKVFQK